MRVFPVLCFALGATITPGSLPAQTQAPVVPQTAAPVGTAPGLSPVVRSALGLDPLLARLKTLQSGGLSLDLLSVRQQILEHVMAASFQVDDVLGRIDSEASYASEDRYVIEVHDQHEANALNLVTFAASGALGAAGSAMQLTHGLNHAGTALQAAAGGTSLLLSGVQLRAGGSKRPVRSPYNMLAELLDQQPNAQSRYPALVTAYLHTPRPDGRPPIAEGITAAWRRLGRLKEGPKSNGAPVTDLVADRSSGIKLSADELADREAMLHDLHATVILLRSELQDVLLRVASGAPDPTGVPQP